MLGIRFEDFNYAEYAVNAFLETKEKSFQVVEKVEDRFVPEFLENEIVIGDDIVLLSEKQKQLDDRFLAAFIVGFITRRANKLVFKDNEQSERLVEELLPIMRRVRDEQFPVLECNRFYQKLSMDHLSDDEMFLIDDAITNCLIFDDEMFWTDDAVANWLIGRYNLILDKSDNTKKLDAAFGKAIRDEKPECEKQIDSLIKEELKKDTKQQKQVSSSKAKGKIPKKTLVVKKDSFNDMLIRDFKEGNSRRSSEEPPETIQYPEGIDFAFAMYVPARRLVLWVISCSTEEMLKRLNTSSFIRSFGYSQAYNSSVGRIHDKYDKSDNSVIVTVPIYFPTNHEAYLDKEHRLLFPPKDENKNHWWKNIGSSTKLSAKAVRTFTLRPNEMESQIIEKINAFMAQDGTFKDNDLREFIYKIRKERRQS